MIWHWPQITYAVLASISLGISFAKHGTPKTGTNDVFTAIIAFGLIVTLLYFGGFWTGATP